MTVTEHSADDIRAAIKQTIVEIAQVKASEIGDSTSFEELGIDSLTATEIMVHVDHRYKVHIPPEDLAHVRTVNDAVAAVQRYLR